MRQTVITTSCMTGCRSSSRMIYMTEFSSSISSSSISSPKYDDSNCFCILANTMDSHYHIAGLVLSGLYIM